MRPLKEIMYILLITVHLVFFIVPNAFTQNNKYDNVLKLLRIECKAPDILENELRNEFYDVIGSTSLNSLDVVASKDDIEKLNKKGLKFSIVNKGMPLNERHNNRNKQLSSEYPSLEEIYQTMDSMVISYPSIVQKYDLTQHYDLEPTFEGRHLFIIKISDNVEIEEDEPDIMIVSNHHAREVVTPVIALNAIRQLTSNYGTDSTITSIVNNNEIWIAPTWNPDGYNHVYNVDDFWRKNRRVFTNGIGVDQNRNYPHLWDGPHSGSTDPSSQIYKGPSAGSEPETKTMITLGLDQRFEKLLDFHSSGREVLWGYHDPIHPFDVWLHDEAVLFSINCGYTGRTRKPSADGENYHWHLAYTGSYAFLVETHTQFTPDYSSAIDEANKVWPGILWNLQRKIPVSGHVKSYISQTPISADIQIAGVNYQTGEINKSNLPFGYFHLFVQPGEYDITFSAEGYFDFQTNVLINPYTENNIEVRMVKDLTFVDNIFTESNNDQSNNIRLRNYPNPFYNETNVEFILSKTGSVSLDIYSLTGKHIISLVNKQTFSHGVNTLKWNGTNSENRIMPAGVYLIRLKTGNNYKFKKCLLAR